jgi:hypothetical protein
MTIEYSGTFKAAVVQAEPVWLDADATLDKSIGLIEEAARSGAGLVAFGETFIPGYPLWIWLESPASGTTSNTDAATLGSVLLAAIRVRPSSVEITAPQRRRLRGCAALSMPRRAALAKSPR